MKETLENCFIHDRVLVCGQDIDQGEGGVVCEPVDGVKLEIMIIYTLGAYWKTAKHSKTLYLYKDEV